MTAVYWTGRVSGGTHTGETSWPPLAVGPGAPDSAFTLPDTYTVPIRLPEGNRGHVHHTRLHVPGWRRDPDDAWRPASRHVLTLLTAGDTVWFLAPDVVGHRVLSGTVAFVGATSVLLDSPDPKAPRYVHATDITAWEQTHTASPDTPREDTMTDQHQPDPDDVRTEVEFTTLSADLVPAPDPLAPLDAEQRARVVAVREAAAAIRGRVGIFSGKGEPLQPGSVVYLAEWILFGDQDDDGGDGVEDVPIIDEDTQEPAEPGSGLPPVGSRFGVVLDEAVARAAVSLMGYPREFFRPDPDPAPGSYGAAPLTTGFPDARLTPAAHDILRRAAVDPDPTSVIPAVPGDDTAVIPPASAPGGES